MYIIKPDNDVLPNVIRDIGLLHPEKEWQVEIKPYKRNKTTAQRNYFHKLLDIISDYSGHTIEDLKTRMCFTLGLTRDVTLKNGEVIKERLSTEGLKTKDYSALVEAAQMACMQLGLSYPDPQEYGYDWQAPDAHLQRQRCKEMMRTQDE